MAKVLKHKGSSTSVEMTASQKLSGFIDDKYPLQNTVSFKASMRILGMKEDDSTAAFVKAALNTLLSGSSGSFSIKLPLEVGVQYEKQLIEAMECIHRALDFVLNTAYSQLSEEDKKAGEKIAEQNILRNELMNLCQARANAAEDVEAFLKAKGLITIPKCIQLESTIISGTRMYVDPGLPGFKDKTDSDGNPTWVKNGEIFGRKRVPLKTEQSVIMSFEEIAAIAKSWEEFWATKQLTTAEQMVQDYCSWASTLPHQDHEIEVYKLDEDRVEEIKRKAAELKKEM